MARRLLVVDDDAANRLTIGALLEEEGFEVALASSLREAREQLAAGGTFDLAILDMRLGDGQGTDLLPVLAARGPRTRTILLSGDTSGADASPAPDARVSKGEGFERLLEVLQRVLA